MGRDHCCRRTVRAFDFCHGVCLSDTKTPPPTSDWIRAPDGAETDVRRWVTPAGGPGPCSLSHSRTSPPPSTRAGGKCSFFNTSVSPPSRTTQSCFAIADTHIISLNITACYMRSIQPRSNCSVKTYTHASVFVARHASVVREATAGTWDGQECSSFKLKQQQPGHYQLHNVTSLPIFILRCLHLLVFRLRF